MKEETRGTHRIEVARTEGSAVFEHLVQALLDRGELICLSNDDGQPRNTMRAHVLTIGINSSDTGSLDDSSRYMRP